MELKIDTPTLRKNIGRKVKFTRKIGFHLTKDNLGIIQDVIKRQVLLGSDYIPFDRIIKIELVD